MVMITGSGRVTTEPSARTGRTRSPRSTTPSSIGIARSVLVVVAAYCAGRGVQCILRAGAAATAGRTGDATGPVEAPGSAAAAADTTLSAGRRERTARVEAGTRSFTRVPTTGRRHCHAGWCDTASVPRQSPFTRVVALPAG